MACSNGKCGVGKQTVISMIRHWCNANVENHVDHKTNEVIATDLAVACAIHLGHEQWLNDEQHSVWSIAAEVAALRPI